MGRWILLFAPLACLHCGATSALDQAELAPLDASCDSDAHGGSEAQAPSDASILDHGTNGYSDAALPHCTTQADCDGWATCQQGLCCSGVLVDGGVCLCGDVPGCDLRHACCTPFTSTTNTPECVSDCQSQCGCTLPPP
jgi:hypothetical protein